METPKPLLLALTAALAAPALAQSAPDAHIVRPYRGDVLAIDGRLEAPAYVPPYAGWRYAPLRAGQRVAPAFYAPRYAVAAPAGQAPVRSGRRWVRYGRDALLVNTRTGRILRVMSNRW